MRARRFVDSAGWTWQAVEIVKKDQDVHSLVSGRERTVLYFMSRYATRHLEEFPDDWPALPSSRLAELCERAKPVQANWLSRAPDFSESTPRLS